MNIVIVLFVVVDAWLIILNVLNKNSFNVAHNRILAFLGTNFTFQSHFCKDFYPTGPKIVFSRYMTTKNLMLASKTLACLLKCPNTFWDKDTAVLTEKKQPPLFISFFLPLFLTQPVSCIIVL